MLLGVIHLEGAASDPNQREFVEAVSRETGFALETANLYEQAVAEKERSEAILSRVGDCVVVTDTRGTILEWNDAAERIIGCGKADAVGHACNQIVGLHVGEHATDCSNGCPLLASAEATDAMLGQEAWRMQENDTRQPLLVTVETVKDRDGRVSEVVHSIRDITRLKQADEAKTMFLATASHELKTPLTVIQGFTETLAGNSHSSDDERMALEAMQNRARQLNSIVDRILLSSRIEAGRAKVACEEIALQPILTERARALQESTGREVLADIARDLPDADADSEAVTTIVDHLLDNAVKYSPDGGPVLLTARSDESWIELSVADRGIGMNSEHAAHCFEKFWQAESSDVRRFGGTGIGLYIVRSLGEAMGGEVSVESTPGRGSTFTLKLVRASASRAAAVVEEPEPGVGDPSVIREFMRQIGVPKAR
jgi:PAS domain S-box-containing protein